MAINNSWHHVVGVRDTSADVVRIYVDGVLRGTAADNTTGAFTFSVPTRIGDNLAGFQTYFAGLIDEVAIFNRALSTSEITAMFSACTDTVPPTIQCPGDVAVNTDFGTCSASAVNLGAPTASDNSGMVTLSNNAPAIFPVGMTAVTWTATDIAGNMASCVQQVTVADNQPPAITCGPDLSVNADPGQCFAVAAVPSIGELDEFTDFNEFSNVGSALGLIDFDNLATGNGVLASTAFLSQGLTIVQRNNFPINVFRPANQNSFTTAANANSSPNVISSTLGVSFNNNSGTDNFDFIFSAPWITAAGLWIGNIGGLAATTVQFMAADGSIIAQKVLGPNPNTVPDIIFGPNGGGFDNRAFYGITSDTPIQRIRVIQNGGGEGITLDDIQFGTKPLLGGVDLGMPLVSDNCGVASVANNAPAQFPSGTTIVTWTVTDANGLTATCQQRVTVTDNQPPTIACPAEVTVNADSDQCSAAGVGLGSPVASDNCGVANVVNNAPANFPVGTTVVTWMVTDVNGLTATCTQNVTVRDEQPPRITCPAGAIISADVNCQAPVPDVLSGLIASDNCNASLTLSQSPIAGTLVGLGATLITMTAVDDAGNSASCSTIVTVADLTPPLVGTAGADTTIECPTAPVFTPPPATDACDPNPNVSIVSDVTTPGSCPGNYSRTVTWKASDISGNSSGTVSQTIIVNDTVPPMIACPPDLTLQCGDSTDPSSTGLAGANDLCDPNPTVTYSDFIVGACPGLTVITRTWRATDACDNETLCVQTITMLPVSANDIQGPITSSSIASPNPAQVVAGGTIVTITAQVSDLATGGNMIASAEFSISGGPWQPMNATDGAFDEVIEDVIAAASLPAVGVYSICLRGSDSVGNLGAPECALLVAVYDPNGGFVTGAGWFNSPAGAFTANPSLTGKANFGFVAKYQHGANIPSGNTEFQFKAGDLNFHSTSYDWLVVAGGKAKYKGSGTINGAGDYAFQLTATDGQASGGGGEDKFRLKIWDKSGGGVIYDNQSGDPDTADASTVLGGGSIVIHKP